MFQCDWGRIINVKNVVNCKSNTTVITNESSDRDKQFKNINKIVVK